MPEFEEIINTIIIHVPTRVVSIRHIPGLLTLLQIRSLFHLYSRCSPLFHNLYPIAAILIQFLETEAISFYILR